MVSRRYSFRLLIFSGALACCAALGARAALPTTIQRVSVSPTGAQGDLGSSGPLGVSSNGRFVVFSSDATNFFGNGADTNGFTDIYLRDRLTGFTELVTITPGPLIPTTTTTLQDYLSNQSSQNPSVSDDGRFVAFETQATNLNTGLQTQVVLPQSQIWVRDRRGLSFQASAATSSFVGTTGAPANAASTNAQISGDGTSVAYESAATNLVAGDANKLDDIFITRFSITAPIFGFGQAQITLTTNRVSTPNVGLSGEANGASHNPSVSADGRYVAFESDATNLVTGDSNGKRDVFVADTRTGAVVLASVANDGSQGDDDSFDAQISPDGNFVVFRSNATNLDPNDGNGSEDVFIRDLSAGVTERVSVATDGSEQVPPSGIAPGAGRPSVSSGGRFVAFVSNADNLDPSDANSANDIFVRDRQLQTTTRVSLSAGGVEGDADSLYPAISGDGGTIAFSSAADNLVNGVTNGVDNVYAVGNSAPGGGGGNQPPDVVTNDPIDAIEGTTVLLDASQSTDPDLDTLHFSWSQVISRGSTDPKVTLKNANTSVASFVAPLVPFAIPLTFRVAVSDGVNPPVTSDVTVTVGEAVPGTLTGRVTDGNNNAIANATVQVTRFDGVQSDAVVTDGNGNFQVTDVRVGSNTVTVTAPAELNLEPGVASFNMALVGGQGTTVNQDFVLKTSAASLNGTVLLSNGASQTDATVTLLDNQGHELQTDVTDEAGEFHFRNISKAQINAGLVLKIEKPGNIPWTVSPLSLTTSTSNDLTFRYGTLRVTVDANPRNLRKLLSGTKVELLVNTSTTDPTPNPSNTLSKNQRTLTFSNVPSGSIRVRSTNPSLTGSVTTVTVRPGPASTAVTILMKPRSL